MPNEDSIGALWKKESSKGEYFSGVVEINGEKYPVVVFPNNFKREEKHPDYRILRKRPKEEAQQNTQEQNVKAAFRDDIPDF